MLYDLRRPALRVGWIGIGDTADDQFTFVRLHEVIVEAINDKNFIQYRLDGR